MSERMLIGDKVAHIILEKTGSGGYDAALFVLKILDPQTKEVTDHQIIGFVDSFYQGSKFLESMEIHHDYPYWILRRFFSKTYLSKNEFESEPWLLSEEGWDSLIGDDKYSDEDARQNFFKMIDAFITDDPMRPMAISELFYSTTITYSQLENNLNSAEKLMGILKRVGQFSVTLIDGKYNELRKILVESVEKESQPKIRYFHEVDISFNQPYGFIIMPFKEEELSQEVYSDNVNPYLEDKHKIKIYDSRDQRLPSKLDNEIYSAILNSSFVIADLTGRNPNVMYELGIAHVLGKPALNVTQESTENLPFDISTIQTRVYDINQFGKGGKYDLFQILDHYIPGYLRL